MKNLHAGQLRPLKPQAKRAGFSLIEVALSLSVVAVGFVSVLGLMGSGLSQYRTAMDATLAAQIAQRVINDAQQADFTTLVDVQGLAAVAGNPDYSFRTPKADAPAFRYFDAQGGELHAGQEGELSAEERTQAVYQVNVRVRPLASVPKPTLGQAPQLAQLTVQVVHVHGRESYEVESTPGPKQNLYKSKPGVTAYTYAALVGRNE